MERQRPVSVLLDILNLMAGTAIILGVCALIAFMCGCGPHQQGEARGPRVARPVQMDALVPSRVTTLLAIAIVDERLAAARLPRVARMLRVTWLPGEMFEVDSSDDRFLGITDATYTDGRLDGCDAILTTNMQELPSRTSLPHEMLHCSLGVGDSSSSAGDPQHLRPEWNECQQDPRPGCGWLHTTLTILESTGL